MADAILQAATTPTRNLKVGTMASLDVAMEKTGAGRGRYGSGKTV